MVYVLAGVDMAVSISSLREVRCRDLSIHTRILNIFDIIHLDRALLNVICYLKCWLLEQVIRRWLMRNSRVNQA